MTLSVSRQNLPLMATGIVCVVLYVIASVMFRGFFTPRVFLNFFSDNAFLGVAALGMTLVIVSGGIDLSVGSVVGCTSILAAMMIERLGVPVAVVLPGILLLGLLFGTAMGSLIHFFELPPFLVTLGGLFLLRGTALAISAESVSITKPDFVGLSASGIGMGALVLGIPALIFIAMFVLTQYVAAATPFGRNVYAIGGSNTSSLLMGLPVGSTRIGVYAFSGLCSALAGVTYTLYTSSGNATAAVGLELDAIAAAVVGGTLLSGGVGHVFGTVLGVLIFGIIQTAVTFQGNLSSWWTRIVVGMLLMVFILLQKFVQGKERNS